MQVDNYTDLGQQTIIPQISLEGPVSEGILFTLLRTRSETTPSSFIINDHDNAGITLDGHISMHEIDIRRVTISKTSYGQFALITKLNQLGVDYIRLHPLSPMYTLAIQKRIMSFLSDIYKALLKEQGLHTSDAALEGSIKLRAVGRLSRRQDRASRTPDFCRPSRNPATMQHVHRLLAIAGRRRDLASSGSMC